MMRRSARLSLDERNRIVELEIDEAFDGVRIRHDHTHGCADAEPLLATLGEPGLPVRLHDVLIVIE
jgi:hypothetical protein